MARENILLVVHQERMDGTDVNQGRGGGRVCVSRGGGGGARVDGCCQGR